MGVFSTTNAIAQFRVLQHKMISASELISQLKEHQFESIEDTIRLENIGWTPCAAGFGQTFDTVDLNILQRKLIATVRIDKKRIPSSMIREKVQEKIAVWLQQNPTMKKVPRQVKSEFTEEVQQKLSLKALPTTVTIDVIWDLDNSLVTILNGSLSTIDRIIELFSDTFDKAHLVLITPYDRFRSVLSDAQLEKFAARTTTTPDTDVIGKMQMNAWILQSYLIMSSSRLISGDFEVIPKAEFVDVDTLQFWIDSNVHLKSEFSAEPAYKVSLSALASPFTELCAAFKQHCVPEKAALCYQYTKDAEERTYTGVLDTLTGIFSAMRFPKIVKDNGAENLLEEVEAQLYDFLDSLDQFIGVYMNTLDFFAHEFFSDSWYLYLQLLDAESLRED